MTLAAAVQLLQTALLLLTMTQGPNVPASLKAQAITVANQAISAATQALAVSPESIRSDPNASGNTRNPVVVPARPAAIMANPGTFYVDNTCIVNGNGAAQTCAASVGGVGAFNSLAAMTSRSGGYAPGNQIYLRRGNVYREILAMPSSGAAGNPIRVSTYGTGASPVVLGSDTKTSWQNDGTAYVTSID